jgi:hypothetical protein
MQRDSLQIVHKFRIPALLCALAVLCCILISRPFVDMGICDDGTYIVTALHLKETGRIVYNGWPAPILGWQLYLGAAMIKLFGYSFTTVRVGTWLVAMAMAFVLQRAFVAADIRERNATMGALALALSPLYLMLSSTYMTDIYGLFAIVICLHGCLLALRARTDGAAIGWLFYAAATNAVFGSARQNGWMGLFIMVPCTLWLLRGRRRVLFGGIPAMLLGAVFVAACLLWFSKQPYTHAERLFSGYYPIQQTLTEFVIAILDLPFLLLPIVALFFAEIRRNRPRTIAIIAALSVVYLVLACYPSHLRGHFVLEPAMGDWVDVHGIFAAVLLRGEPPIFLNKAEQVVLTIVSLGGLIGLLTSLLRLRREAPVEPSAAAISWKQLGVLLGPFAAVYALSVVPRAIQNTLFDRYVLGLLVVLLLCLVRYYQERIHARLPWAGWVLVAIMAVYGIAVLHNLFSLYRARVDLAAELRANGVPDTSVDNGWEYNFNVELKYASHINDPKIGRPKDAYTFVPKPTGRCYVLWYYDTPHIHPLYGVAFDPNACYGPAPFAPVHYSRWLTSSPGTLYVVRYTQPTTALPNAPTPFAR